MKIYLVGGAVRDKLLGLPVKERDWVVIGATPEEMLRLGYRQVGKEFPVFLHPSTHEEYALARMERKVKPGYQGFVFDTSPNVSLEQDLIRRDLTINAIAESPTGECIDPYHGAEDLKAKILRHVSPAFSEDPVRILRVGRFLARYAQYGFHVAPETTELMRRMVQSGEVNALVAERVWKEWERALAEKNPEKFFEVLESCGALAILFPQLNLHSEGMAALTAATTLSPSSLVRFAALLHALTDMPKALQTISHRYRIPNAYLTLAKLVAKYHMDAINAKHATTEMLLSLLTALDVFRREARFLDFITAVQAIANARSLAFDAAWLQRSAEAAKSVNISLLLAEGLEGEAFAARLKEERLKNLGALL